MVRVLIGLALAAGAWLLTFRAPPAVLLAIATVVTVLALREYFVIAPAGGARPFEKLGYAGGLLWLLLPNLDRGYFLSLFLILLLANGILGGLPLRAVLPAAGLTVAGVLYVAGPMLWGLLLHDFSPHWLAFVLLVTAIGDASAWAVGKKFGRHKLAPLISPLKTWEGTLSSVVIGTGSGVTYAAVFLSGQTGHFEAAVLALAANVFGQLGDLVESALKRADKRKNSGRLIPGHGGILDRIDSLLFAIPVLYGYLQYIK